MPGTAYTPPGHPPPPTPPLHRTRRGSIPPCGACAGATAVNMRRKRFCLYPFYALTTSTSFPPFITTPAFLPYSHAQTLHPYLHPRDFADRHVPFFMDLVLFLQLTFCHTLRTTFTSTHHCCCLRAYAACLQPPALPPPLNAYAILYLPYHHTSSRSSPAPRCIHVCGQTRNVRI